ncbi:hypothetical protein [Arenibacter algicola]|uniref:Transposase n=1 Tax=Arenibacter algicola TaxID=616991 RepID=A0A221V298_9FLAO|nr:hypothetical protein [Arenibacter algicola]ASO07498.1 hypothetical protein AREALGSMS7_04093 [Arenibacter algicola]
MKNKKSMVTLYITDRAVVGSNKFNAIYRHVKSLIWSFGKKHRNIM